MKNIEDVISINANSTDKERKILSEVASNFGFDKIMKGIKNLNKSINNQKKEIYEILNLKGNFTKQKGSDVY